MALKNMVTRLACLANKGGFLQKMGPAMATPLLGSRLYHEKVRKTSRASKREPKRGRQSLPRHGKERELGGGGEEEEDTRSSRVCGALTPFHFFLFVVVVVVTGYRPL